MLKTTSEVLLNKHSKFVTHRKLKRFFTPFDFIHVKNGHRLRVAAENKHFTSIDTTVSPAAPTKSNSKRFFGRFHSNYRKLHTQPFPPRRTPWLSWRPRSWRPWTILGMYDQKSLLQTSSMPDNFSWNTNAALAVLIFAIRLILRRSKETFMEALLDFT